ncbi:hypothetical protein Avbf_04149 [Armadillidium vulgare]|nr:hypothetical protein Avbf_04149 [Armadillidium vulgare]
MNINEKSLNNTNELPIFSLENQVESGLPTISRRSGLPRLTSNFPSVLQSRSPVSESNHSGSSVASSKPSRAPSLDSIGGIPPLSVDSRASTPEVSQHSTTSISVIR